MYSNVFLPTYIKVRANIRKSNFVAGVEYICFVLDMNASDSVPTHIFTPNSNDYTCSYYNWHCIDVCNTTYFKHFLIIRIGLHGRIYIHILETQCTKWSWVQNLIAHEMSLPCSIQPLTLSTHIPSLKKWLMTLINEYL